MNNFPRPHSEHARFRVDGRCEMYFSWTWSAWVIYCNYMCIHENGTFPSFRFPPNCWSAKLNTKELWMSFYISKSDEKADIVGGGSTSSSAIFSPRVNMNTENKKLCGWNKQYTTFHAPHSLLVFCAALFTYVSFFFLLLLYRDENSGASLPGCT